MILGDIGDITRFGAKEFQLPADGQQLDIFVVYYKSKVYGYKNSCPHHGLSLNWISDQFLDHDKTLIQCSNHGALFRIEDGTCVARTCVGKLLIPIAVVIDHNKLILAD